MTTCLDDLLDLFDYAWHRFRERMAGVDDEELAWQPAPDERITLRWRIAHIAQALGEERNGPWLGLPAEPAGQRADSAESASIALARADDAYARWRAQLAAIDEVAFAAPIGAPAGRYGEATRRSFALHVLDELIHHAAEAALLRDLYPRR